MATRDALAHDLLHGWGEGPEVILGQVAQDAHGQSQEGLFLVEAAEALLGREAAEALRHPPARAYGLSLPPVDVCAHDGFQSNQARYAESTCPFRQWGAQPVPRPHAGPQPGGNPCPACWVALSETLNGTYQASVYLSIDPDYPYAVTGGTLDILGHGEIDLGAVGTLEPGDEAKITEIPIDGTGPFEEATVNFRDAEMMIDGSYLPIDSASSNELVVWTE